MCPSLQRPLASLLLGVCLAAVTTTLAQAEAGIAAARNLPLPSRFPAAAAQHPGVHRPEGSRRRLTQGDSDQGHTGGWIVLFNQDQRDAKSAINKLMSHVRDFQKLTIGGGGSNTTESNNMRVNSLPSGADPSNSAGISIGNSWDLSPLAVKQIGQDMSAGGDSMWINQGGRSAGSGPGVKGLVLDPDAVDDTLLEAIKASDDMVMIPNYDLQLEGRPMQDDGADGTASAAAAAAKRNCSLPAQLSSGIPGSLPASVWSPSCVNSTRLLFLAETCGASANQILYRAVMAVDKNNRIVNDTKGRPCLLKRDDRRRPDGWNQMRFGVCGKAPRASTASLGMPTAVCTNSPAINCLETTGGAPIEPNMLVRWPMTTRSPVMCNRKKQTQFTMQGVSCGPDGKFIHWTNATADDGCVLLPNQDDPKFTADMFGLGCGAPPALAVEPLQTQQCVGKRNLGIIGNSSMPRMRLPPGVSVPAGVARIEAYHPDSGLVDMTSFRYSIKADKEVQVAVIDSGIDASHPDLNVHQTIGAVFGVDSNTAACEGDESPIVDCYGHGTQVAGVVGATSNAAQRGLIGVVPGIKLVPLKVVNGAGQGQLGSLLRAMDYAFRTLANPYTDNPEFGKVKVVVISLTVYIDPGTIAYETRKKNSCKIFEQASEAGMVIVAAAGNYARNIEGFFPACCPSVLAVTAIDVVTNEPASSSNYLPDDAQLQEKSMLLAAPGTRINATTPKSINPTGYMIASGTSVAAPHVAGVAASCMMTDACSRDGMTGAQKAAVLQNAAVERTQFAPSDAYDYTYTGGPGATRDGKFYGNLVWDKF